jgi:hypothetical protein
MKMKKYTPHIIMIAVVAVILSVILALNAMAAETWKQRIVRFSATAGETLATGDVVCISGTDGYVYKADANDSALRPAVGVIGKGGASGATVEIVVQGILAGQTAASPGARLFLSETAGAITTTEPTNTQALGWILPGAAAATTSTTYFIMVNTPASPGAGY